ncbi:MAG: branched chain amino acid aminotransferase, partial [Micrococcales bacterium]|nr:branched chain amino acid aminotransferase [Micrococcales bacterium]
IKEWKDAAASGELVEVFACGTAAVVTPVGNLQWEGGAVTVGDRTVGDGVGPVTTRLRQTLLDIQYGRAQDTHGWMTRLV